MIKIIELICHKEIDRIVINYQDRLIRFGYEIIEQLCLANKSLFTHGLSDKKAL